MGCIALSFKKVLLKWTADAAADQDIAANNDIVDLPSMCCCTGFVAAVSVANFDILSKSYS